MGLANSLHASSYYNEYNEKLGVVVEIDSLSLQSGSSNLIDYTLVYEVRTSLYKIILFVNV